MATDVSALTSIASDADREWRANVSPENWTNPVPKDKYDLVVIGAGTGGLVTSAIAAALGARVALIERHFMGGDCLNVGCVPSKALLRASRAWVDARAGRIGGSGLAKSVLAAGSMKKSKHVTSLMTGNKSKLDYGLSLTTMSEWLA